MKVSELIDKLQECQKMGCDPEVLIAIEKSFAGGDVKISLYENRIETYLYRCLDMRDNKFYIRHLCHEGDEP